MTKKNHFDKVTHNNSNASPLNTDSKTKFKRKKRDKKLKNVISANVDNGSTLLSLKKKKKHNLSFNGSENVRTESNANPIDLNTAKASKKKKHKKHHNNKPQEDSNTDELGKSSPIVSGHSRYVKTKKKNKLHQITYPDTLDDSGPIKNSTEVLDVKKKKKKCKKSRNAPDFQRDKVQVRSDLEEDAQNFRDDKSDVSEFDMDSYPSDTDNEAVMPISDLKMNFADASSAESSLSSDDDDSQHTFDADSYPSDTEDEDEKKKGLPMNSVPTAELQEREKRTIFVGNLPYSVERMELKKWFFKFGPVECVRLRSAPIADPELPRKVAVIKKAFHESRSNIHAYIRFKTVEAAKNALQANGALFKDHVLRVDSSVHEGKYDASKGIFVGNLSFSVEEDVLRKFFLECGEIESVRIIRDKNTGVGKGFGYVNFKCSTSVPLALKFDGDVLEKRELRVKPIKYQKKNVMLKKPPPPQYHSKKFFKKPLKKDKLKKTNTFQGEVAEKRKKKQPKKKTAEERKHEKFSQILTKKSLKKLK